MVLSLSLSFSHSFSLWEMKWRCCVECSPGSGSWGCLLPDGWDNNRGGGKGEAAWIKALEGHVSSERHRQWFPLVSFFGAGGSRNEICCYKFLYAIGPRNFSYSWLRFILQYSHFYLLNHLLFYYFLFTVLIWQIINKIKEVSLAPKIYKNLSNVCFIDCWAHLGFVCLEVNWKEGEEKKGN